MRDHHAPGAEPAAGCGPRAPKLKLLVVELWGLGDLIIATPFLQAAARKFSVTLLAKPYARDLQPRFWPDIRVVPFVAPWTAFAFEHKYRLFSWPWREIFRLRRSLIACNFDYAISGRWDPRDHLLLRVARARERFGFPRLHSEMFLTRSLARPEARAHRYEHWRVVGAALGLDLPPLDQLKPAHGQLGGEILVHTGAGQPVRVWPLERYRKLIERLRRQNYRVRVACDPDQQAWWRNAGEAAIEVPRNVADLLGLIDRAAVFIGNDSGPGHLTAFCGVPTFTIFGPQLPEWFAPLHPLAENMEGKACPYKPCSDYCRFTEPYCLSRLGEEEVWARVEPFVLRMAGAPAAPALSS